MSDHIDKTDKIIYAEVARGLAAVRRRPGLVAHGCCHYCDEPLAPALLFCGVDCRDDHDKELAAKARAGRPGWPPRRHSAQGRPGIVQLRRTVLPAPQAAREAAFSRPVIADCIKARKIPFLARRAQLSPLHTCPLYRALLTQICAMAEGA